MEYSYREATPQDREYVNNLTQTAMGPWVEASWETEEEREVYYRLNEFDQPSTQIILVDTLPAGRLSCRIEGGAYHLDNLHLESRFHGSGLGSRILKEVLNRAEELGLPVELKCLKTNPVQGLYERFGFVLISEDEKRLYYKR